MGAGGDGRCRSDQSVFAPSPTGRPPFPADGCRLRRGHLAHDCYGLGGRMNAEDPTSGEGGRPGTSEEVVQGPLQGGGPLRTPRAAAFAGIFFSVLLIAALVLLRLSVPADPRVPGSWLTDSGRRTAVDVALLLVPFAGIAFLWFIGGLRDRIGHREERFFRTV